MSHHHEMRVQRARGIWEIARPLRDTNWWHQWRRQRACAKSLGHCWHPEGMIDWWCCSCSANTDGMPANRCRECLAAAP